MENLFKHNIILKEERQKKLGHLSPIIWLTGLSASGKSTIATKLEKRLFYSNYQVKVLDGDNVRLGLNKDLSFSDDDRKENIRRVAEVAKLFSDTGIITITSFISPFSLDRQSAREIIGDDNFIEVFIKTPLEVCIERDPKGLYKKALAGEIKNFTGINSVVYEEPIMADIVLDTVELNVDDCVNKIITYLLENNFISNVSNWDSINHGNGNVKNNGKQKAVFIGRYQPYHYGHIRLVEQKLNLDIPVLIMVRDIKPDDKNPFTTEQTVNMIRKYHESKKHNVEVIIIPDIESVNYGRGVGYEVNEFIPPKDIENISATMIRDSIIHEKISGNSSDWRSSVDIIIQDDIINYLNEYEQNKNRQKKTLS